MDEAPKYQIYLSTSPEVQRSSQAVLIDTPDDKYQCIYTGEGTLTDSLFIPAIMHNHVQKGNVYLLTHPDDYEGGMYDGLKTKEEPQ
jgi:hypothetical protein